MKPTIKRSGFSALELLVAISVTGVLLVITVGWIHQTMKYSATIRQHQENHLNLTRLARQLRDDVRQSKSLTMNGNNQLNLVWEDGTTETFTISNQSIDMEKTQVKTDSDGQVKIRESYELAGDSLAVWDSSELPNWISLIISKRNIASTLGTPSSLESQPPGREPMPVELHVRVAPNRWTEVVGFDFTADKEDQE